MIFQPPEGGNPVEPAILMKRRRSFDLIEGVENCPRSIKVALGPSQKEESYELSGRNDHHRDEG